MSVSCHANEPISLSVCVDILDLYRYSMAYFHTRINFFFFLLFPSEEMKSQKQLQLSGFTYLAQQL